MQRQTAYQVDRPPWDVRSLLESTATPFSVVRYKPGEVIFHQGDPCDRIMYIETGRVRLSVTMSSGREAINGLLEAGGFLGEEALAYQGSRRQTATAMTATQALVVARAEMSRLLHTEPTIADRFLAHVLARNVRLEADLKDQLLCSSEQRLARTLLVLARCDDPRLRRHTLPDVSQEHLAQMVGTTRSRVNGFIRKFRKLGFIEEDGGGLQVTPALVRVVQAWQ